MNTDNIASSLAKGIIQ